MGETARQEGKYVYLVYLVYLVFLVQDQTCEELIGARLFLRPGGPGRPGRPGRLGFA